MVKELQYQQKKRRKLKQQITKLLDSIEPSQLAKVITTRFEIELVANENYENTDDNTKIIS